MATKLGELAVGSIVKLNENGAAVPFYVAHHNYESDLNGSGRTLLVRYNLMHVGELFTGSSGVYANSAGDVFMCGTYKERFDADVQNAMAETRFRCTLARKSSTVGILSRSVFALSCAEYGYSSNISDLNTEGSPLAIADILRNRVHSKIDNSNTQGTRSIVADKSTGAYGFDGDGKCRVYSATSISTAVPAFTLPETVMTDDAGNVYFDQLRMHTAVSGVAREVDMLLAGVDGVSREVDSMAVGINGVAVS